MAKAPKQDMPMQGQDHVIMMPANPRGNRPMPMPSAPMPKPPKKPKS